MLRMSRLILHPSLGLDVLNRLREFTPLPSQGVVAGQAVASVLDHLQGLRDSPINDVDVFRLAGTRYLRRQPSLIGTIRHQDVSLANKGLDYASLATFLERMRSYRVSTVSRNGLLNFVNCDMGKHRPFALLTPSRVIQSFDLNCVRVAVDLATGELVWDRHFENFLKYRRVEICAMHTPWHTFLRALKKSYDLPEVTLDLPATATIATTFANSHLFQDYACHGVVGDRFGPKLRETAEKMRGTWSRYFQMEEKTYNKVLQGEDFTVSWLTPRADADTAIQHRVNALHNASLHFAGPVLHALFRKNTHKLIARVHEFEDELPRSNPVRAYFEQDPCGLLTGHVSPRHIGSVAAFLKEHPKLVHAFAALTLDEQFEAAKTLQRFSRQVSARQFARLAEYVQPADLREAGAIEALHSRVQRAAAEPLRATALVLPRVPAPLAARGFKLRELLSIDDFETSKHFSPTSYIARQVREGTVAVVEISSVEEGKPVITALEIKLEATRPTVLTMIHRSPGRRTATPSSHRLLCAIVMAKLTGNPLGKGTGFRRPGGPADDVPF